MSLGQCHQHGEALQYKLVAQQGKARVGELILPHHKIDTPVFMPVGTQGSIKGMLRSQVVELDSSIILGNTYHLGHRPGPDVVDELGGLHSFMDWPRNLLTGCVFFFFFLSSLFLFFFLSLLSLSLSLSLSKKLSM